MGNKSWTQALNFDKIISENENISLEDLPIESLVQTDFDSDHLANLINQNVNNNKTKPHTESVERGGDLFDLDLECLNDIEDNFDKSFEAAFETSLPPCYINLIDFASGINNPSGAVTAGELDNYPDSDEIFSVNGGTDEEEEEDISGFNNNNDICNNMKSQSIIRRQSTRIQNQVRKKIAEKIQSENIRLAKEAKRLNSSVYESKNDNSVDERLNAAASRYMSLPTDLDAEDDNEVVDGEWNSEDDPNKLWCICKQPYGYRFMICCDNCSEWYHGDCVGVTQEEGARMEENGQDFICPVCIKITRSKESKKIESVVISDDDEYCDPKLLIGDDGEDDNNNNNNNNNTSTDDVDDDCQIVKTVKPVSNTSNIFQIFKTSRPNTNNELKKLPPTTLSARTSVCLNTGCKTLVNPKRSLYCSKKCIIKYSQMVKKNNQKEKVAQYGLVKGTKLAKITRFVVAQIETEKIETQANLKEFLFKNPTYKVFQSSTSKKTEKDQLKSKEANESLTKSAVKRVKVVKHFALTFKKTDQNEFRSIWQQCVNLENSLFRMCDKTINEKYISKVKELCEFFKSKFESRPSFDVVSEKLFISDLLKKTTDQFNANCKTAENCTNGENRIRNNNVNKKSFNPGKTGISMLLSDTTHLHSQHLYDFNCKICNGTSKKNHPNNKQANEKDSVNKKDEEKIPKPQEKLQVITDTDFIRPPTDSCSPESIVTSWFKKSEFVNLSPVNVPNDEFKVTSTVETPDMAIDMELCSTPSVSEQVDNQNSLNVKNSEFNVDSSSKVKITPVKQTNSKPTKQKLTSVWEGEITYKEVGSVACKTYLVSRHQLGKSKEELKQDEMLKTAGEKLREEINLAVHLGNQIKINGRTKLSVIQDYLSKLRKHSNKEFLVFRLHPTNLEDGRKTYLKMFEFFHGRDRCGVIDQKRLGLKDCFIYPLNAHSKIPSFFLPLNGPGFEKRRPHMLLMLVVRTPLEFNNTYKSFSPKYDQDHDFVKNHGINLEKYLKPPVNISICPSPISGNLVEEEKLNESVQNIEPAIGETTETPIQEDTYSEILCEKETMSYNEIVSHKSDNNNNPAASPINIESLPSDAPSPIDEMSPPSELISNNEKDPGKSVVNFDPIFNPTKVDENIIPFLSLPESQTENLYLNKEDIEDNFTNDFDLRVLTKSDSSPQYQYERSSGAAYSVFNISSSKDQKKRFYTFYDAHFDDPDHNSKRAKYFYNPRLPNNTNGSNRSLPI